MLAFLERREDQWTRRWLQDEVCRRADDPSSRLLAIFDVFDEWFHAPDFEGCSFINVLLEHPDPSDPVHRASVSYLAGIRGFVEGLAREAGVGDAQDFARQWHIPHGSIVAAGKAIAPPLSELSGSACCYSSEHASDRARSSPAGRPSTT